MVRDPHISPHNSSLCRSSYPRISLKLTSCHKSNFEESPYENKEDTDRHDIVARRGGGISLEDFCDCHSFVHTNEAVYQELIEGRLLWHTNRYKQRADRP